MTVKINSERLWKYINHYLFVLDRLAQTRRGFFILNLVVRIFERFYASARGNKVVDVFGDSHAPALRAINFEPQSNFYFRVVSVQGASILGCLNRDSASGCYKLFTKYRDYFSELLLVHLGEVDCGYLLWTKSDYNLVNAKEYASSGLSRVFELLNARNLRTHTRVFLCNIPLPILLDGQYPNDYSILRPGMNRVKYLDRLELTCFCNEILKKGSIQHDVTYIDSTGLTFVNGQVLSRFRVGVNDHHYNRREYGQAIAKAFAACVPPKGKRNSG